MCLTTLLVVIGNFKWPKFQSSEFSEISVEILRPIQKFMKFQRKWREQPLEHGGNINVTSNSEKASTKQSSAMLQSSSYHTYIIILIPMYYQYIKMLPCFENLLPFFENFVSMFQTFVTMFRKFRNAFRNFKAAFFQL